MIRIGRNARLRKRIGELQTLARDHQSHQARGGISPKAHGGTGIFRLSYDFRLNRYVFYWGYAEATVTGGLYMDRGDGTFNNGPSFVHDFSGTASVSGDCWGCLSVSDTFVM